MSFYTKLHGKRVPVRWHRTLESLHHASADGSDPVCGQEEHPLLQVNVKDGDISRSPLVCNRCAEHVFRVKT